MTTSADAKQLTELGVFLESYRIENGITKTHLAKLLKISTESLEKTITGKTTPRKGTAEKISQVLGLTLAEVARASMVYACSDKQQPKAQTSKVERISEEVINTYTVLAKKFAERASETPEEYRPNSSDIATMACEITRNLTAGGFAHSA